MNKKDALQVIKEKKKQNTKATGKVVTKQLSHILVRTKAKMKCLPYTNKRLQEHMVASSVLSCKHLHACIEHMHMYLCVRVCVQTELQRGKKTRGSKNGRITGP
jgi:uncharacterized protein YicC (UPF0701 family)